ncbi:MAG: hypothetical protein ABW185_00480 [Sedimenticola sp.]
MLIFTGVSFDLLGDSTLPMTSYDQMIEEAARFIIACYNLTGKTTLTEARVEAWKTKMRRSALEPPKLCSLPPTSEAFRQNALRAHYQLAAWRNGLQPNPPSLDPTDHGWSRVEGTTKLIPTIVPLNNALAPAELLKVIKCGCESSSPCSTKRCGCRSQKLTCTLFCVCRGGDACGNKIETFAEPRAP